MSPAAAVWPAGWPDPALVAAAGAVVLALLALLGVALVLRRRSPPPGLRELRRGLADLAEGRFDLDLDIPPGDPAASAGEALVRLAQALRRRVAELEARAGSRGALLESVREAVVLATDADYDVVLAGGAVREVLGEEPSALKGRHLGALVSASSWEKLLPRLARRSLREEGVRAAVDLVHRDGEAVPALLTAGAMPGGGLSLLLVPERDRRGGAPGAELFGPLVEAMADGAAVVQDGAIVYANHGLARMVGVSRDHLVGRPLRELIGTRQLLVALERLAAAAAGRGVPPTRLLLVRADGEEAPVEARMSPVVASGRPAVALSLRDQAAEVAALARVRAQEARLDAALEASADGLLVVEYGDARGGEARVALANRRFAASFGLAESDVLGRSVDELWPRLAPCFDDPERVAARLAALVADRAGVVVEELRGERPSARWLELYSAPVRDAGERSVGRIFSFRDVSARKQTEIELREDAAGHDRMRSALERANADLERLNADLRRKGADLERLNEELRQLDAMKSDLLSDVSHELQTPLVSIKGYTEMILAGRLGGINDEQRQGLEIALRNINRLIGMINNLLSFSRLERDAERIEPSVFSIAEAIHEVRDLLREAVERKAVTFRTRYETEDLEVRADRGKVVQVLTNLLDNAVKYNRRGGEVAVAVREGPRGFLAVEVRDSGVGIPANEQRRIFDRFYRSAGGAARGTGIGLAIVHEILRQHGCTIEVESAPGQGSAFRFTLPLARTADPGPSGSEAGEGARAGGAPPPGEVRSRPALARTRGETGETPSRRRLFRLVRPRGA